MKLLFTAFICGILSMTLEAQTDHLANSYKERYDSLFPTLKYSYDSSGQTHNYSCNWDFDGDKKPDSLYFVGNGGAHLYFHLRLILSSEGIVRDFDYLVSDFPMLDSMNHFKKVYGFMVHDFNNDGKMEIYLNTDTSLAPIPPKWIRRGVTSGSLLISYEKKNISIKNFPGVANVK
ncbi:MAG: VCBS repeat-containing protein [Chitinophagaceae bacterium]